MDIEKIKEAIEEVYRISAIKNNTTPLTPYGTALQTLLSLAQQVVDASDEFPKKDDYHCPHCDGWQEAVKECSLIIAKEYVSKDKVGYPICLNCKQQEKVKEPTNDR